MAEGARLIVAEDEALIALDLERTLSDAGHRVVGMAATASAAVRLAEEHRPDLAIVDARLARGSNGLAAVRDLRDRLDVPSIVVTGHLDEEQARAAGAFGFLRKPFRAEALLTLVQAILDWRSTGRLPDAAPAGFLPPA